jgi:alpha-1,6-mannosyltransferase
MLESAGRDARAGAARLKALGASGVALGLCLVGFDLLYLSVPSGWTPPYGFAPDVAAAFAPSWPVPRIDVAAPVFRALAIALLAGMWGAFLLSLHIATALSAAGAARTRAQRLVAVEAAVIGLALILSPPTLSRDLYHYAMFGKMVARGLNPYLTPIDALAGDPLWALANWRDLSTHYGPVFTALSALAALVGGGGVVGTALAFKTLATAFGALAAWAAFKLAEQAGRGGLVALVLVAWNPLILLETAGSGHNEAVMLGLALGGVLLARRGRPTLGFAVTAISAHVKWVTAALAALMAVAQVRERDDLGARARELGRLVGVAALATAALYAPFWAGRGTLGSTRQLLGGAPGVRSGMAGAPLHLWGGLAFAAVAIGAAAVVWRAGSPRVLEMAAAVSLAFVIFVFPWLFPWYLIPALALLAVGPPTRTNRALLAATLALALLLMLRWAMLVPGRSA